MPSDNNTPLVLSPDHVAECFDRWIEYRNNDHGEDEETRPDEWYFKQCGGCRYYIPLCGLLSQDWGVCSNAASPFDRTAMFEHDGCNQFTPATEWVSEYIYDKGIRLEPPEDPSKVC